MANGEFHGIKCSLNNNKSNLNQQPIQIAIDGNLDCGMSHVTQSYSPAEYTVNSYHEHRTSTHLFFHSKFYVQLYLSLIQTQFTSYSNSHFLFLFYSFFCHRRQFCYLAHSLRFFPFLFFQIPFHQNTKIEMQN